MISWISNLDDVNGFGFVRKMLAYLLEKWKNDFIMPDSLNKIFNILSAYDFSVELQYQSPIAYFYHKHKLFNLGLAAVHSGFYSCFPDDHES